MIKRFKTMLLKVRDEFIRSEEKRDETLRQIEERKRELERRIYVLESQTIPPEIRGRNHQGI
jgi:DNA transposition AAA+ family ATPase